MIENAPTRFTALRGKQLAFRPPNSNFPEDMTPTEPSDGRWASTISVANSSATILKYGWTMWTLEFHDPAFTYDTLQQVVFACPAVVGWPRYLVSGEPAVKKGNTIVSVGDTTNLGGGLKIDVQRP